MKKDVKTIKRINAFCLALLAAALVFSCLYIPIYADSYTCNFTYSSAVAKPSMYSLFILSGTLTNIPSGTSLTTFQSSSLPGPASASYSSNSGISIGLCCYAGRSVSSQFGSSSYHLVFKINGISLSTDSNNPTDFYIYPGDDLYFTWTEVSGQYVRYYYRLNFPQPTPEPTIEPTPTPVPDLSYLLPNSDISLPSLTIENFNDNVDPVIIGSASNAGLFAFAAPSVEIYGCYIGNTFYFFTKDDRAAANSVGVSETDFMGRLVSITLSNAITPYPLTSVKYGSISSYSISSSEKNSSFIIFSSLAEAAAFYDTYIEEPTYTPEPPPTPTPGPYDPAGVPTIPPGDPSYETFFNKLAADAQSAFNALYQSWMGASSKFYTGLFFIGLPIAIAIFGLVASIVFGDDD